jgi:putative transposase
MNYFRYKQFNKDVITVAVGYYLRYALSYRDISEILRERGVNVHHSTVLLPLGSRICPNFVSNLEEKA